jgi:hypothetical protein
VITRVSLERSVASHNSNGVQVYTSAAGAIARLSAIASTFSGNSVTGGVTFATSGGSPHLAVSNSLISENGVGLQALDGKVVASANLVTENGTGFGQVSGTFESTGNNTVRDNTSDTSGTITNFGTI